MTYHSHAICLQWCADMRHVSTRLRGTSLGMPCGILILVIGPTDHCCHCETLIVTAGCSRTPLLIGIFMIMAKSLRQFATKNVAMLSFVACYSATIVFGNLIYASPYGAALLQAAGYKTAILQFSTTFSLGFWALLLSPLLVVPLIVAAAAPMLRPAVTKLFKLAPSFTARDFAVISLLVYCVICFAFYRSGAVELFMSGTTATDAIEARFAMQAGISFLEKVTIHSIMPFLAYYAFVAFLGSRNRFWAVASALSIAASFVVLIFLNMKWPVLLFSIGIVFALLMFSRPRRFWLKLIGSTVTLAAIYLLVSTVVFRLAPEPAQPPETPIERMTQDEMFDLGIDFGAAEQAQKVAGTALSRAPFLIAHAINRMAVSYPYYYLIFTEKGPVCGTLIEQYVPGTKPCHPSYLVYKSIFGADGYEDRGTSPAAPHITAYAFQGWIGAALGLAGMGVVLAFFAAVPYATGPMASTWTVLGAIIGYHLSQVPGDEIVFYATGVTWPFLLVLVYSAYRLLMAVLLKRDMKPRATVDGPLL